MKMTGDPIHFVTTEDWRSWLEGNHAIENDAWLMICKRNSRTPSVTVEDGRWGGR
jgi:uncharacterized protein YdeI (YjbR/CyaY-like superfamily)